MSFRLWYRTYTNYLDVIPDTAAFITYTEAEEHASQYMTWHGEQNEQYIKTIEIQHVQCGEMVAYCECEADA